MVHDASLTLNTYLDTWVIYPSCCTTWCLSPCKNSQELITPVIVHTVCNPHTGPQLPPPSLGSITAVMIPFLVHIWSAPFLGYSNPNELLMHRENSIVWYSKMPITSPWSLSKDTQYSYGLIECLLAFFWGHIAEVCFLWSFVTQESFKWDRSCPWDHTSLIVKILWRAHLPCIIGWIKINNYHLFSHC